MYQNYQYEVDPHDPFKPPLYQGTFEETVGVSRQKRAGICCISWRGAPLDGRCVCSAGERQDSDDLWRESGWRRSRDTEETNESLILFFLEPENGKW